jgi:ABC-2 type transport system ATP-binding protein
MALSEAAIVVQSLTKKFDDVTAVDGLSLTVDRGELFGLLGPNGAGKTTTLNILCGLLDPTSGSAAVGGYDVRKEPSRVKALIGVSPQATAVYPHLTGRENIELFANLQALSRDTLHRRVDELLQQLSLRDCAKRRAGKCSGGMVRRINLAMALVHDPEIAFLDEPTVGMDPQSRRAVWEFLRDLEAQQKTVLLTTHYMEEAEALCDRVGIIDNGKLIALGTPPQLKDTFHGRNLEEVFLQLTGRRIREDV